jgi:amidase
MPEFVPAVELARQIAAREISPVEVVDACVERIERRNPELNAFVLTAFDQARESARAAERAVTSGEELGPLHGVPTAMKDLFDFKPGWVSTFGGVPALRDFVADNYCVWAERMEGAGAILVGKTNSPALGFRAITDNQLFGPTRNPFDGTRNPGGSSGGSAAAVAAGLVPFAEATDAGGSARVPAAWCNVFGYKPSAGRVPVVTRPDGFGGVSPFVHEGLVTRTVADAVLGMRVLAGPDPRDPFCLLDSPDYQASLDGTLTGWRIAYSPDFDVWPIDPRVAALVEDAVQVFAEAGASVERVRLGIRQDVRELSELWLRMGARLTLGAVEGFRAAGLDLLAGDELPLPAREWLSQAYAESPLQATRDSVLRTEIYDLVQGVFLDHDLLVTPTVATLPVLNGARGETVGPAEIEGVPVEPLLGWALTSLINLTGHPAASVPAGLVAGLPVGMQVIGRRQDDGAVLRAGAAVERLRPWAGHYPG